MRVLYFVVDRFRPYIGGVEVISARILSALAERGMEITVVTDYNKGESAGPRDLSRPQEVRRIEIDRVFRNSDLEGIAASRAEFGAIKREVRPDLLHMVFTGLPGLFFPVMTANISPTPMVLSFHGSWPLVDLRTHALLRKAIELSDWLTACSDAALADLRALDDSIAARSHTILNGLEIPVREPSPLLLDPPVLLCSARVVPEKGLDLAIDAVALLRGEFPGIRLRIVGDGPVKDDLERQVERLGLGSSVEFLGWRSPDSIAGFVDEASLILVPSILEGFGLIALEGMLGGRPVVASRAGGLPGGTGRGRRSARGDGQRRGPRRRDSRPPPRSGAGPGGCRRRAQTRSGTILPRSLRRVVCRALPASHDQRPCFLTPHASASPPTALSRR